MTDLEPSATPLPQVTPNIIYTSTSQIYTGLQYAITGDGGYSTEQGLDTIHRGVETLIETYDTTGAVEVLFDVRIFNDILGIQKDASNINVLTTGFYDNSNNLFVLDTVSLTATQFLAGLNSNTDNIISVGKYSSLYSDFAEYIAVYFGLSGPNSTQSSVGFDTLFSGEYNINPNDGLFDASAFLTIISGSGDVTSGGAYVDDLSGSIIINNITKLLRNAVDANPFGNRDVLNGITASDINYRSNYGVTDGFFENDLIFIPEDGIGITLNLAVDTEGFPLPLNNIGPTNSTIGTIQDASFNTNTTLTSTFEQTSSSTVNLITRTSKAPLLLRLMNLSHVAIILSIGTVSNTSISIIITSV
jgi:hypothetical protein